MASQQCRAAPQTAASALSAISLGLGAGTLVTGTMLATGTPVGVGATAIAGAVVGVAAVVALVTAGAALAGGGGGGAGGVRLQAASPTSANAHVGSITEVREIVARDMGRA